LAIEPHAGRNWGDILFGAVISLAVSIVGGIAVYYYSRDTSSPPHEALVYTIDQLATFEADSVRIGLATLKVRNSGNASALQVAIAVETRPGVRIRNHKVAVSSGPAGTFSLQDDRPTSLRVAVPNLAPEELVSVNLVLEGSLTDTSLAVGVKSASALAKRGTLFSPTKPTLAQRLARTLPPFILILILTQVLLFALLKRLRGAFRNVNNTAFLLLHSGLPSEAGRMLKEGIQTKGADSLMLANYGLSLGLAGNRETAEKLFSSSEFYVGSGHEKAVVAFNRALVAFSYGDAAHGTRQLDLALNLSARTIRQYARFSSIVRDLKGRTPEIATAFARHNI
jgi:hypothetical protein